MVNDKWQENLSPVIKASPRLAAELPELGEGSRGGDVKVAIRYRHGPTQRFMTGGGSDKARAGFTSRVLIVTETDGMDVTGASSREADKISQLEGRQRAYTEKTGRVPITIMECTVSTATGRTWREIKDGTDSRIVCPCPHCAAWVCPEREHLVGWEDAETINEAKRRAVFVCPVCAHPISESERDAMVAAGKLIHRGQTINAAGDIAGDDPETDTLGFRYSAFHNLFVPMSRLGAEEWSGRRDPDEENAEKKLKQWIWTLPHDPPVIDVANISQDQISRRGAQWPQGVCPDWTDFLTVGVDLGKYVGHYTVLASGKDQSHVVDHGRFDVPGDSIEVERAVMLGLMEFLEVVAAGYVHSGSTNSGKGRLPDLILIDCGWKQEVAFQFCAIAARKVPGATWEPIRGCGSNQRNPRYHHPKKKAGLVRMIGNQYYVERIKSPRLDIIVANVDYWKLWVHEQLECVAGEPGSMTLYAGTTNEHLSFSKHITAERRIEKFVPLKGVVTTWERIRKANHWLDTTTYASIAAAVAADRAKVKALTATPQAWLTARK